MFHTDECRQHTSGNPPPTLRELTIKRIVGRTIYSTSPYLGSYGMGGPGFFGLGLKKTTKYPEEWLVLTAWAAAEWLLVNGKCLDCFHGFAKKYKPIMQENGTMFHEQHRIVEKLFAGYKITEFDIQNKSFSMTLKRKGKKTLIVDLPEDLSKLPPFGCGDARKWKDDSQMLDGFIVSDDMFIDI